MQNRAVASFEVTGWDQLPPDNGGEGPVLSRATVGKAFNGDLVGESTATLLMCQADTSELSAGAGYVASERFAGQLAGKQGTFVMQHWGVSEAGGQRTGGHVVPGSGTSDLAGLTGEVAISVDADGAHTLTLDYEID
ncbi:MAG: DUF3224 domain-containing protein [Gemmatimonadota bacterium]